MLAVMSFFMVGFVLIGIPMAFAIIAGMGLGLFFMGGLPHNLIIQRIATGVEHHTYLAIPLFIMAGTLMERSGISVRLVAFAKALVGHIKGGMGHVVVVSEIFFSGISGASLSDASAIGSIMYPALRRSGYEPGRATALIAAACAMGILIPPCLTMVVLGAITGVSVAALFVAGFIPGFLMAVALMLLVYFQARRGLLPAGEPPASWAETARAGRESIIPLMLPVIIFGGIFGGIFTATEAAAVAVLYALIVTMFVYRDVGLRDIYRILVDTSALSGAIGLIVGAATAFSAVLTLQRVPAEVADLITGFSSNPYIFMIISNIVFVLFGAVLDGIPALLMFIPILYPVAQELGIDPLHYTLLSVASLGIGMIIPPIGIMTLVICSLTKTSLRATSKAMIPYLGILFACLVLMIFFPSIVLVLPQALGLW